MDSTSLPLLLASDRYASAQGAVPLDRLRMQKGVFLLQMRGPDSWRDAYRFIPWDWGPYSRQLATDVGQLMVLDQLEAREVPFREYRSYRTTAQGEAALAPIYLPPEDDEFARQIRAYITSRSFGQLLREVYAEYPDYAVNSRFRG